MTDFVWAIIGPGRIAHRFVDAVHRLPGACLLADEAIDGVYIATPHWSHAGFVRECLLAGKAVLCEKPLAPKLALAGELAALSQARRVFLMEAFWTRLLPV